MVLLAYLRLAHPVAQAIAEEWYQQVERRLVADRRRLVPPSGTRWFGMYRPELPWDYGRFRQIGAELGVESRIVAWYQSWGDGPDAELSR